MMSPLDIQTIVLDRIRVGLSQRVGAEVLEWLDLEVTTDRLSRDMVLYLTTQVLAQKLPPQTVRETVEVDAGYHQWASPWSALFAHYQGRWWLRWLRRWREPQTRYVERWIRKTVEVEVESAWTFPESSIRFPPELGRPVLQTWTGVKPWTP